MTKVGHVCYIYLFCGRLYDMICLYKNKYININNEKNNPYSSVTSSSYLNKIILTPLRIALYRSENSTK